MTKENEQYAYLTIAGDFDPDAISARLGLKPTACWQKGEVNPRTGYERTSSRWSLRSRVAASSELEEHVRDVLEQTREKAEAIREIGREFKCWVQLVGYFHAVYPGFVLDHDLIGGLAAMNAGLDCDFYYLYSHEREDSGD